MKTLLRSTFAVNAVSDHQDSLTENFRMLEASGITFEDPVDHSIWTFIRDFVQQHKHPPELSTLRAHFERSNLTANVDRIEEIAISKPKLNRGDFEHYLNNKAEDRRKQLIIQYLQEAGEILQKGVEIKNGKGKEATKLFGPSDAMSFLMDKAHDILTPVTGIKIAGEVTSDVSEFLAEYERVKNDPRAGLGQMVGLGQMDECIAGAKRHELWVHAGYTSHGKSLCMLNWAYNQAVYYRNSVLIFSLEMPYHQCRRLIYLLHSGHEKFRGMPGLDYQRVRDGQCTAAEEAQLKVVAEDFGDSEYGQIHIEVRDPNKSTFTIADVKHRAETIYARTPFQLLFIDHALLLDARKWVPSLTDRMNEVLRESKQLAMTFNRGLGMAVVCLFQINRDGFKQAMKRRGGEAGKDGAKPLNNHVYDLTALAQTSEAERSADIVTATWLDDDLRSANQILYQCLKNRDGKLFEPFLAGVHWPTRRLFTLCDPNIQQVHRAGQEIDISQVG